MVERRPTDYLGLIGVLVRNGANFIVVGGVAAIVEGAPITTLDLDIVFDRDPRNVERLAAALREVNARYRDLGGREIVPDVSRLANSNHNLHLRVRAEITSAFRIPSAPHLRLELNREILNVARATPRILLNPSNQICGTSGRAKREVIFARTLTDCGPLDVLGENGDCESYGSLKKHSSARVVGDFEIFVLGLATIIETKEFVNSAKDRAVLPVLRKTLELKRNGS